MSYKKNYKNRGKSGMVTRRTLLTAIASAASVVAAAPVFAKAPGFLKGAGDIRKIRFRNFNTGEFINSVYWIEGSYVDGALQEINYFMRDWRQNKERAYDPANIDILSATQGLLDSSEPFYLLSGYRTRKTNKMLSRMTDGVAQNSYHVKAMAADIRMRTRSTDKISKAAKSFKTGGVGRYARSGFVHIDSGPFRTWTS
ncbi:MAG: YcbK family protein [Paracoccaceae bacterium]